MWCAFDFGLLRPAALYIRYMDYCMQVDHFLFFGRFSSGVFGAIFVSGNFFQAFNLRSPPVEMLTNILIDLVKSCVWGFPLCCSCYDYQLPHVKISKLFFHAFSFFTLGIVLFGICLWCVRCLLITESPKTPGHFRYLIWVLCYIPYTGLAVFSYAIPRVPVYTAVSISCEFVFSTL